MSRPLSRRWIGECQYRGLNQFYLGTVEAETEMQAVIALQDLWKSMSPHPIPDIIIAIPGYIIINKEENANI